MYLVLVTFSDLKINLEMYGFDKKNIMAKIMEGWCYFNQATFLPNATTIMIVELINDCLN